MPFDPLVKTFLDHAALLPRMRMWDMPIAMGRQNFAGMMAMVGPRDVPVGQVRDFAIPGPAGDIPARLYVPVTAGGAVLPALIYFHGGGFVVGDLDTHDGLCRLLAMEGGFAVIAVDYRRAPEHKFPAAMDDAYAAVRHVFETAPALGVDAGHIAVGGDSSGGLLAAVVTQRAKAHGSIRIAYQMLLFPGTELGYDTPSMRRFATGYMMDRDTIKWLYDQFVPEGVDRNSPELSPLNAADFSGLPPAFVMLGGYDPLHDEGFAYAEKLKAAGVPVTIDDNDGMVHCFIYLQSVLPQAHQAVIRAAHAVADGLAAA